MGAILDIIGSYIFKAAMIGIIIATSVNLNAVMVEKNQIAIMEKNLNVAISILEWDLKNINYNYTNSSSTPAILVTGPYEIKFKADLQNDGVVEDVQWTYTYIGYDPDIGYRYDLRRSVNGVSYTVFQKLYYDFTNSYVSWRFTFYDGNGSDVGYPSSSTSYPYPLQRSLIRGIKVFMKTKSDVKINGNYLTAEREFTVYPPNLSL